MTIVIETLDPLCQNLTKFEGNSPLISQVFPVWRDLQNSFGPMPEDWDEKESRFKDFQFDTVDELLRVSMKLRWELFGDDVHLLAYLLDYTYRPHDVTAKETRAVYSIFKRLFEPKKRREVWRHFNEYRRGEGDFADGFFDADVFPDPIDGWMSLVGTEYNELARLAVKTLLIPSSSVSCERGFSILDNLDRVNLKEKQRENLFLLKYNAEE